MTRRPAIALVDYGAGNLTSVAKGLRLAGASARRVSSPDELDDADAVVIPGVGHFAATASLDGRWRVAIAEALCARIPVLGICLGLQWLFEGSEEAPDIPGLGVFPGKCALITGDVKVPHVGWNTLEPRRPGSRLLAALAPGAFAYFSHSYAAPIVDRTVATTSHGTRFTTMVEGGRVFGVQFHPELSGTTGLQVLRNFVAVAAAGKR